MDLNAPERINNAALKLLQKQFAKVEPKLLRDVTEWLNKFRTTSGNIVRGGSNLDRVAAFKRAFERFLQSAGYYDMVNAYLKAFDKIEQHSQHIHKELNDINITKGFISPYKRIAIEQVVNSMTETGLNESIINPIRNELFIAVNQGSSLKDVIKSISGQLQTTEERMGIVRKLAIQSSRDALLQYDGVVNEAVRKTYKLDGLFYVGSIVNDSRPQCERWVNYDKAGKLGVIPFAEIQSEIEWAENNGTGMIPNTTPENFCQNRGGFNCRHICYPIRLPKKEQN